MVIDREWADHIRAMDDLDDARRQIAMGKVDDQLAGYRRNAAKLFSEALAKIDETTIGFLFNLVVEINE